MYRINMSFKVRSCSKKFITLVTRVSLTLVFSLYMAVKAWHACEFSATQRTRKPMEFMCSSSVWVITWRTCKDFVALQTVVSFIFVFVFIGDFCFTFVSRFLACSDQFFTLKVLINQKNHFCWFIKWCAKMWVRHFLTLETFTNNLLKILKNFLSKDALTKQHAIIKGEPAKLQTLFTCLSLSSFSLYPKCKCINNKK